MFPVRYNEFYVKYLEHACCDVIRQIDVDLRPGWHNDCLRKRTPEGKLLPFTDEELRFRPGLDEVGMWDITQGGSRAVYMGRMPQLFANYGDVNAFQRFYNQIANVISKNAPTNPAYLAWRNSEDFKKLALHSDWNATLWWAKNTAEGQKFTGGISIRPKYFIPYLKVSFKIPGPCDEEIAEKSGVSLFFSYIYNNEGRYGMSSLLYRGIAENCDYPKISIEYNYVKKDIPWLLEQIKGIPDKVKNTPDSEWCSAPEQINSPNLNADIYKPPADIWGIDSI